VKDDALDPCLPDSSDVPELATKDAPPQSFSVAVALESLILVLIASVVLLYVVPKFAEVYAQTKFALPPLTRILVRTSELVTLHPWILGPFLIAIPFSLCRLGGRDRKLMRGLLPFIAILLGIAVIIALFLPLMVLLEGIGARRH
jgi:hypothetical protein